MIEEETSNRSKKDFSKGKIYIIRNTQNELTYIGSTCQTLAQRMAQHRKDMKNPKTQNYKLYQAMNELGKDAFYIELLEDCPCQKRDELLKKEGEKIREYQSVLNKLINGRSKKESSQFFYQTNRDMILEKCKQFYEENKEMIKAKNRQYYHMNSDVITEKVKQYQQTHKENIAERKKLYHQMNKEKISRNKSQYRENNKDKIAERNRERYKNNREQILQQKKEYHEKNKDKILQQKKQYQEKNKDKIAERSRERYKKKTESMIATEIVDE